MSIKKILITILAFSFMFINTNQNTLAMKRSRDCTSETDVSETPRKRACPSTSHQTKDDTDLASSKKRWKDLSKEEIKRKLLSGYSELNFNCELLLLSSKFAKFSVKGK